MCCDNPSCSAVRMFAGMTRKHRSRSSAIHERVAAEPRGPYQFVREVRIVPFVKLTSCSVHGSIGIKSDRIASGVQRGRPLTSGCMRPSLRTIGGDPTDK